MEYTPAERLRQLWKLVEMDQDCMAARESMEMSEMVLDVFTKPFPKDDGRQFWGYPVTMWIYFHRVLEVVSRQMRFPEESAEEEK